MAKNVYVSRKFIFKKITIETVSDCLFSEEVTLADVASITRVSSNDNFPNFGAPGMIFEATSMHHSKKIFFCVDFDS